MKIVFSFKYLPAQNAQEGHRSHKHVDVVIEHLKCLEHFQIQMLQRHKYI